MAVFKRGGVWWYEFVYAGKRIRESAKTSRKTIAIESERNRRLELEKTHAGMPTERRENRIMSVNDFVRPYIESYGLNHRPTSVAFITSSLKNVQRLMGNELLPDVTEQRIRQYVSDRLKEDASGRSINAELGELSRALGKHWSVLWPRVRKLEENKDVGKALSAEEEQRLIEAAQESKSPVLQTLIRVALLTGMRIGELTGLTWRQIDFGEGVVTVGKAKTAAGTGRQIPMNDDLLQALGEHKYWFQREFGETKPEYFLFPFGSPTPSDPTRPMVEVKTAWETVREKAKVDCRWHDFRHTVCTKLAEAGVPESTMLAIMGHMSRSMLERYSHIRLAAKRQAVLALNFGAKAAAPTSIDTPTKVPTRGTSSVIN